jgi:glycyl-tRNA synthetase
MKKIDQKKIEQILKSRFFMSQTAQIYGGAAGLYDMGPVLFGMKQNFFTEWRRHFVYYDRLFEIDTSILLPYPVLKASGHVDKFCDILLCDETNGTSYRADHYISQILESKKQTEDIIRDLKNVDCMTCKEIDDCIKKYNIKTPEGNNFSPAMKFNLMFETNLGYKTGQSIFLRPETAQGQFLNFKKLYEFNNKKIPFGSATIGKAFRNEISPRSGLIRTREFEQAEIEYFVSPSKKDCEKFSTVNHLQLLLCYDDKEVKMNLGEAVKESIIDNESLGYFIGRTYLFLINIGIDSTLIRFRQHKADEMAHYAKDCWDCELYSSYGWIECVGIADRSAYDLTCHSQASGVDLSYSEKLENPEIIEEWKVIVDKNKWIKILKRDYENFKNEVENFPSRFIEDNKIQKDDKYFVKHIYLGKGYEIECQYVTTINYEKKVIPDVIEPSFGVGRILYILIEHSFYVRECGRSVLKLKPRISPTKCVISYLMWKDEYMSDIEDIKTKLYDRNIVVEINDRSCSIGKKYASCDELGIPFFVTFDVESLTDKKVTLRERDSMEQVRLDISKVSFYIEELVYERISWEQLRLEYL